MQLRSLWREAGDMRRFGACRGQEVALARQYSSIDEFLDYLITICKD
jgi:hypothetical protein